MIFWKKIQQAFSDASLQYEVLTNLHKEIGRELLEKVRPLESATAILDIGMGTGWLTHRLAQAFPQSRVVGLDFASGMIQFAQKHREGFGMIQADACRLPFKKDVFDVILSNLTYQWIRDLPSGFRQCHGALKNAGIFRATMFGYHTLQELFQALEKTAEKSQIRTSLSTGRLAQEKQITEALQQAGFHQIAVTSERIKARFPDMMHLLKWTKEIGANTLKRNIFIGRELLGRMNDYYDQNYRDQFGVYATFEVVWVMGRK